VFLVGIGLLLGLTVTRAAYESGRGLLPLVVLAAPVLLGGLAAWALAPYLLLLLLLDRREW
jgi:hypothetical protein